ncbi:translation initiation factor IF-2 [SAR202 cluster bacterium AD-804-J14_MRT_500m]|nr:translation initiation factor IF-2 [SAR202 cluster bacterium AD-804-J14_MRT_500m]MQF69607.1 translation initiation factor IF-2 [SAR202 cluster bacterium AD-804-J14_MRT_500m]
MTTNKGRIAEAERQNTDQPERKDADRKVGKELVLPSTLSVKYLADSMGVDSVEVIKQLMRNGIMAAINQVIDYDLAALVCPTFGFTAKPEGKAESVLSRTLEQMEAADKSELKARDPIVTILGHVDHGKTTLLDTIRSSRVTDGEVGGITQHIGAYQVQYKDNKITFLDTPGHEAFTAIRARGASVTDIAVLVVAANDGVMPQTVEAINHAKAANLPLVVAINKMDMPDADPDTVKRQLTEHELLVEEWGGDVIAVPISAKDNMGIDDLLQNIQVVAEIGELKAHFDRPGNGTIIEVQLNRSKGPLATVLVQNGVVRVGDSVVAGGAWGRVRAMVNDLGERIKEAGPSVPIEILGFSELPQAGDAFYVVGNDRIARAVVDENLERQQQERTMARVMTLEDVVTRINSGEVKELNLILKADVQGSVEAVKSSLERLDSPSARVNILHAGSGAVNESDILLAGASDAIIFAFSVGAEPSAGLAANRGAVQIRTYDIIYKLIEDVEAALKGILDPVHRDVIIGKAEIREVFGAKRRAKVAGVLVTEGRFAREGFIRVLRDGELVYNGSISSLRRFKDDVNEVTSGLECGIGVEGFDAFVEGDLLEAFRRERT